MASFESGLECEDTRVDTDHQAALDTSEPALHIPQHGQLAMPGICPDCNRYLLSCTRPGVLQCDDFKSALQA
jgi:hypothetical protein